MMQTESLKPIEGILVVDKSRGMTSHDVVYLLRRKFNVKKIGHAGTLDPMASGVLVMLIGSYTKMSATLISDDKEYSAEMTLGGTSDTGDAWGKIENSGQDTAIDEEVIRKVFAGFVGSSEQRPPMYSAVKHKGKKLYQLARKGIIVDVKPKTISIKSLRIDNISLPKIKFTVLCSKGTYIRQLVVDIGNSLGCGAYLSALCRTKSGRFTIDEAVTIDTINKLAEGDIIRKLIKS